jgi:membrane protein implicated in regulation of membrane protease activity
MEYWLWMSIGLFLLGIEMFTPTGMYLLIIGLACICVGGLVSLGLASTVTMQCLLAAALTILFIFTIRKPFHALLKGMTKKTASDITAQTVTIAEAIAPGAIGKGELSGTTWTVQNNSAGVLEAGSRHRVASVHGLTLVVH